MAKKEQEFVAAVWDYYETYGRHTLPWRLTHDPYQILVSELMLQQTQVQRVVPKYEAFMARWPTAERLANAPLSEVLKMWQGLGYNRRAKFLHECAKMILTAHAGKFPESAIELQKLPGIGPYTASAICVFAYNQPVTLIETNVRQVYIHHFFNDAEGIADAELLPLITKTVPQDNAREWYAALMDYGTYLKREYGNLTKKSKHYTKQSAFKGSDRQIRGAILRALHDTPLTIAALLQYSECENFAESRVREQLAKLCDEALVSRVGHKFKLG